MVRKNDPMVAKMTVHLYLPFRCGRDATGTTELLRAVVESVYSETV